MVTKGEKMKRALLAIILVLMCNMAMAGNKPLADKTAKPSFDTMSFDNKLGSSDNCVGKS